MIELPMRGKHGLGTKQSKPLCHLHNGEGTEIPDDKT